MRTVIARALLGTLLIATAGASLVACSHTWEGVKQDFHSDTRK